MATQIPKLVPQAIVLGVAVYWCWPFLEKIVSPGTSVTQAAKPASAPAFTTAMLSPTFPKPSNRNPFIPPGPDPASMAKNRTKSDGKDVASKMTSALATADLQLKATYIAGNQRLALINGRVYKEKEPIQLAQTSDDDSASCIVTDIFPHKVMLLLQGKPVQLTYTNLAVKRTVSSEQKIPAK